MPDASVNVVGIRPTMCRGAAVDGIVRDIRPSLNIRLIINKHGSLRLATLHPLAAFLVVHVAILIVERTEDAGNRVDVSVLQAISGRLVCRFTGLHHTGKHLRYSRELHLKHIRRYRFAPGRLDKSFCLRITHFSAVYSVAFTLVPSSLSGSSVYWYFRLPAPSRIRVRVT